MSGQFWPGLDLDFNSRVKEASVTPDGRSFERSLGESWIYSDGKLLPLAHPLQVGVQHGADLWRFVSVYHAAIERIVRAFGEREDVRAVVTTSPDMVDDVEADTDPALSRVDLCRVDFLLDSGGGFHAIETNANCPGGLLFTGMASRAWRGFLTPYGFDLPEPLEHEGRDWMAGWYLDVAEEATGDRPEFVALIRAEGGNRLELPHLACEFNARGVEVAECDPEQIRINADGDATFDGRVVRHAYQKLGMQEYRRRRPSLDGFVTAVRTGKLFVQNGQRGRWIGDSKLCLAVLSDPSFASLFSEDVVSALRPHVPWSRNVGLVESPDLERIRNGRGDFVLKRPLDTRGSGVVIGREASQDEWSDALDTAVEECWLVQAFHMTTTMELGGEMGRHDLAIGAINGRPVSAFSRTSAELRVNVARSGEVHPVFLGR